MTLRQGMFVFLAISLVGCSGSQQGPAPHSSDEQKAIDEYNKRTPQQQIDAIQNGRMPDGAKVEAIKAIKEKNGIK